MGTEARIGPGFATLLPKPGAGVLVDVVEVVVVVDELPFVESVVVVVVELPVAVAAVVVFVASAKYIDHNIV